MQDKQCGCGHWGHWGLTVWMLLRLNIYLFIVFFSGGWGKGGKGRVSTVKLVEAEVSSESDGKNNELAGGLWRGSVFYFTFDWQEFSETLCCHVSFVSMESPLFKINLFLTFSCCCFTILKQAAKTIHHTWAKHTPLLPLINDFMLCPTVGQLADGH